MSSDKDYDRKYYQEHKEERKIYNQAHKEVERMRQLKKNYGITIEEWQAMFDTQCGRCAICGTTAPGGPGGIFAVDHDHKTGKVRGLLCHMCNKHLGVYENFIADSRVEAYLVSVRES